MSTWAERAKQWKQKQQSLSSGQGVGTRETASPTSTPVQSGNIASDDTPDSWSERARKYKGITAWRDEENKPASYSGIKKSESTENRSYLDEARNAYESNITTETSLSDDDRNSRIAEIKKEMSALNTSVSQLTAGISRARAYGNTESLNSKLEKEQSQLSSLSDELKGLERAGTHSLADELNWKISDAKEKVKSLSGVMVSGEAEGRALASSLANNPDAQADYKNRMQSYTDAKSELKSLEREKERIEYIADKDGKKYEDNFSGQFGANLTAGRLTQDQSLAWNEYLVNPTEENRAYAEAIGELLTQFSEDNEDTLADDATLPWISQSLANYLPQLWDQVKYSAAGGAAGALGGSVIPGVGTALGAKAGIVAGSGLYSYNTMRGAAYENLLELGVDDTTARAAANDEAVVSSLIEMADTGLDIVTLGGGKLLSMLGKGGVKALAKEGTEKAAESALKKLTKALGAYGLNIGGEMLEEASQEGVTIANESRVARGDVGGAGELAGDAVSVLWQAASGQDDENASRIWEAGKEGGKVAAMMGGGMMAANRIAGRAINEAGSAYNAGKTGAEFNSMGDDVIQATIETGLESDPSTDSYKLATQLQQKLNNGETVSNYELGRLYQANVRTVDAEQGGEELLRQAAEQVTQGTSITNRTASDILDNTRAVSILSEDAGLTLMDNMTKSQRRAAVKSAVETLASRSNAVSEHASEITQPAASAEHTTQEAAPATYRPVAQQAYDVKRVQRAASALGENGAKALTAAYDGNANADSFYAGFASYYEAGVSGMDMGKVQSEYSGQLNRAQKYAAYVAGQNDAAASLALERRAAQYAKVASTDSGLVFDDYVAKVLNTDAANRVNSVAKALGVRVRFVDSVRGGTANAQVSGSDVLVERGNQNPVMFLLGHEWTHRMQELAPDEYRAFRNSVAEEAQGEARVLLDQYRRSGEDITYEAALDEAAANYAGRMIEDGKVLDDFIAKHWDNRTLLEKALDAIRSIIAKLTGAERRQAQTAEGKLTAALEASAKQASALQGENHTSGTVVGTEGGYAEVDGKFSLKGVVEDNGDLLALHSLTEQNLRDALKLGGLPMPSIAIVQARAGHAKYGPISLVFSEDTIDPRASNKNKVYGGDAYTPTAPRVDRVINTDVERRFARKIRELAGNTVGGLFSGEASSAFYFEDTYTSKTEDDILDDLTRNYGVKAAYLADQGKTLEPVMREKANQYDSFGNEALKSLVEIVGQQELASMDVRVATGEGLTEADKTAVRAAIRGALEQRPGGFSSTPEQRAKRIEMRLEKLTPERMDAFVRNAEMLYEDGMPSTEPEVDRYATMDALREAAPDDAVRGWVRPQLDGLLGEPGIYNGKDPFTPSGNRKGFSALHNAYTLENIVKAMTSQRAERGEAVWGVSAKSLQATATPSNKSVKEIKADSGRLGAVEGEEYEARVKVVDQKISDIISKVKETSKAHSDNPYTESDIIASVLLDAAKGRKTVDAIVRAFSAEGYTISSQTAQDIQSVFKAASELPTEYFEAKPRRAVRFDEVLAAVVPDDMDAGLRKDAEKAGMRVLEYKSGDDADRLAKVNSVEGARFSLKTDSEDRKLTAEQQEYFQGSKVLDDQGRLLVLYHGTTADFNKFAVGDVGYHLGTKEQAERRIHKSGKLMSLYANIQNPLEIEADYGDWGGNHLANMFLDNDYFEDPQVSERLEEILLIDRAAKGKSASQRKDIAMRELLQSMGYDGIRYDNQFEGNGYSYIAFSPEQIKAVDNKTPTRDPDIRYSLKNGEYNKTVVLNESTVDTYLKDYAAKSSPNYAQAYIAYMGPDEFLDLTTSNGKKWVIEQTSKELDAEKLGEASRYQPIQLHINHETGEVEGHEGRHRAVAIRNAGIERIPVLLFDTSNKYDKSEIDVLTLQGQDFGRSKSYASVDVFGLLPLSYANRDTIIKRFATQRYAEKLHEQYGERDTLRLSLKGTETARDMAKLLEENDLLRDRVDYWKGQTKRTQRVTTDKKAVTQAARDLIRSYGADLETSEIAGDLQSLYDYISSGYDGKDELTYAEARRRAEKIARTLVDNAVAVDDDQYRQYSDLRSYLRSTKLTLSKADSSNIADYNDFRKRNFGRLNLGGGSTNVDQVYLELSEMWPEFFDEQRESHPADQLLHIADVLDSIYDVTEYNPFSRFIDRATTGAANEIMEKFFELPQTRETFADRQARKLDEAKAKGRQQVQQVREQKDARMEELRKQNQQRVQDAIQKERTRREEQLDKLKTHYREKDAAGRERRSARELRAKIARHANALSQKLLRPSDKQHIPEKLRQATAAVLDAINRESAFTVDPDTGKRVKDSSGTPTKRTEAFRKLRLAYADITKDGGDYTLIIDPDLMDNLNELEAMRDTPLAEMGTQQLSTVWATLKAVEASIRTANTMLGTSRFETISQFANGIKNDNILRADRGNFKGILGKMDKLANLDMLTPQAYFHRMGSTGEELFRMLRAAQDRHISIMRDAQQATEKIVGKADINKLERETHTFDIGGEKLIMSTAQIMSLYELMKREQAQEHILVGGIRPDAINTRRSLRENQRSAPVHIGVDGFATITGVLTDEQIKMADDLQKYMGGSLAELGNEASMEVYGYRKFNEPDYFPIQVDKNQTKKDIAKEAQAATIAGRGFTKSVAPKANNAVMVNSIFDVYASHVNDMATYAAWLATMENVRRIRDFTFRDGEGARLSDVKTIIERVFGKNGNAYLNRLVDDINQGIRPNGTGNLTDGIVGNYKAAAVAANIRVILQQPTAILRALDTLDTKYLLQGTVKRGDWEKVMKYAPIARWKDWGYFDINTGRQMKDVLLNSDTMLERIRQAGMAMAGKADSFAWARLWNAVEAETKDTRPGLKQGTDEFYKAVSVRFSEIIDRTQVVDGLLQRSQIMRSPDALTKMSTSFMAEPTKTYNMFANAVYDVRHAGDKEARSRAKKALARTTAALVTSFAVNALAQAIVDAMRDDDKEKDYWEKLLQAYTGFSGDEETFLDYWNSFWDGNLEANFNPLSYLPYFKDLLSIAQGYDVTRMDMEAVEKVWTAATNMKKALTGEGKYTLAGASANLMAEAARMLGLPVANLKRDVQAAATTAAIETDNYLMQYRIDSALLNMGYSGNSGNFMDILYNASINDPEAYEIIYADMVKNGVEEDKIRTAMESRMKRDQGVESVKDLEARYLTPSQEKSYSSLRGEISGTTIWTAASEEQREALEGDLYDLTVGNTAGEKLQEKIDSGSAYGISETDYLLYRLAQDVVSEDGNNNTSQEEAEAAVEMLSGLSSEAKAYLWQSTNKGWKESGNPFK